MPVTVMGPLDLNTQYLSPLTAEELAELELLYQRVNDYLISEWDSETSSFTFLIESETFSLYPERVLNQIVLDCENAGWETATCEVVILPNSTKSREYRGLELNLSYTP